ncbi:MAG TPA: prolipoprotein diacylglyceryl transferase family protein [Gemmatimonadaceae bacterium]|nr:prolipoprotein diacylglyceryl transferase family protein [Gemmatimonadaceae bacterium]
MHMLNPIVHHPFKFALGPLEITGFGLAVLLAFVIAEVVAERELTERGHDREAAAVPDVLLAALIGTMAGGKLYYVLVITHRVSDLWSRSGFVFWGGFIGSVLLCWLTIHRKKLSFARFADVAGIALAAGYSVGRTGCWAIGDDYGKPYAGPLAVAFPDGSPVSTARSMFENFHVAIPSGVSPDTVLSVYPTQLMEVLLGFVMFLILWRLRRHQHAEGWLFGVWAVLAGAERFVVEFFRAKDDRFGWALGLSTAQLIALAIISIGAVIMVVRAKTRMKRTGLMAVPGIVILLASACVMHH